MKVLLVASRNKGDFVAFVKEQGEALRKQGVEIDYFGIEGKGYAGYLRNLPSLKKKIGEFKPDIVHGHFGLSGLFASLQSKVPTVITFHNGETLGTLVNYLSSIGAMRSEFVIYVARHIRDLSKYKAKNYAIIPCGVTPEDIRTTPYKEARSLLGFKEGKKYVLFGGAFSNLRKNYPLLKEAVELLKSKYDIECIEMRGLNREQINLLMSAVDCFALPTKSEGSPQALKEAMFCGCPIVATDVADIRHLLGDIDGHYICTFDPEDVADKLDKAFQFNSRTDGRKRILELGLTNDEVAKKVKEVYSEVLKKM